MPRATILFVEDEKDLQQALQGPLREDHYATQVVSSGEAAIRYLKTNPADLILLDPALTGMDGAELCRRLQADSNSRHIPIIIISEKLDEVDIVTGLELGACDYIVKPFSVRVAMARIRVALREREKSEDPNEKVIQVDNLIIDPVRYEVRMNKKKLPLTLTEFRTLRLLAMHPGRVFTRQQIVDEVRGEEYAVTERAVDVQVFNLRAKLGDKKDLIETVRGVGYRFLEP